MLIVSEYPPLMDKIDAAFNTRGKPVYYAWGDRIFNPMGAEISPALRVHEAVHGERQLAYVAPDGERGVCEWWLRYIADPKFRLAEELPAHRAEFEYWCRQPGIDQPVMGWRSMRHKRLHTIATRLASPLYGGLISLADAKREISGGRV